MGPVSREKNADGPPDLPDEVRQAFEALRLDPGDWRALYSMPFLLALWDDDRLEQREAPQAWAAIDLATSPGAPAAGLSPKAVQFLQGLLYEGRKRPEEAVRLRAARELLCWHLSKGLTPEECSRWFEQIGTIAQTSFAATEQLENFARVLAELRESVDDCLPRRQFARMDEFSSVREPAVQLDWLHVRSWQALLVVPLCQLVWHVHEEQSSRLCNGLVEVLTRTTSPLADLLIDDNWELAFRTLTTMDREDSRARIDEARRILAQGLATLRLRRRDKVLEQLISIAEEARWVKNSRWSRANAAYDRETINHVFDSLRVEIGQIRRVVADATPAAAPSPAAEHDVSSQGLPPAEQAQVVLNSNGADDPSNLPVAGQSHEAGQRPVVPRLDPIQVLEIDQFPTIGWQQCLDEAMAISIDDIQMLLGEQLLTTPLLFEEYRSGGIVLVPPGQLDKLPKNLWFIGDLHCDLLALVNAWHFIKETSQAEGVKPYVIFLGDFGDRGPYGCETLRYLFRLIHENPGQIGVLPGNHDEFYWDQTSGLFVSLVTPAETTEQMNAAVGGADSRSRDQVRLGRLAARFFADRPKAIFLPDGLLLAHGGFPHSDLTAQIKTVADLSRPEALKDFVWLRCSNARRRRPNRASSGCEFGQENFAEFCAAAEGLGVLVRQIVRGHDHIPERYRTSEGWVYPATTINTMCRPLDGEFGVERYPLPCIARHLLHQLPQIHRLRLETAVVEQAYGADPVRSTRDEFATPASDGTS